MYNPRYNITRAIRENVSLIEHFKTTTSDDSGEILNFIGRTEEEKSFYIDARKYLESKIYKEVSEDFIQRINSHVIGQGNNKSLYRSENNGYLNITKNVCLYCAPNSAFVLLRMKDLISWINNTSVNLSSIVRIAIAHYELLKIHPFSDGNGRTARLLSLHMLRSAGYDSQCCTKFEVYFEKNKKDYCKALENGKFYDSKKDITKWIEHFCTVLLICVRN